MLSSSVQAQARPQAVDQLFQKADFNHDGKITKNELTQALQSDSVKLGSSDQQANVDEFFKRVDTGNKGYITKEDAGTALNQAQTANKTPEAAAGGRDGGGGGAAIAVLDSDPADTNQDGKVSMQEELAYVLKRYAASDSAHPYQSPLYG
jgi:Ca2+-binding EF-hand superfamily protein